jgi:uncharacterized protein (DUF1499 family)
MLRIALIVLRIVGLIGAAVVVAMGVLAWISKSPVRSVKGGVMDGRLKPCPGSPNCVISEGGRGDEIIEPFSVPADVDPAVAFERLRGAVQRAGGKVITTEAEYLHAEFTSRLFGFVDDLELRLDRETRLIQVRAAARVGRSDLGANRARVETIRRLWRENG